MIKRNLPLLLLAAVCIAGIFLFQKRFSRPDPPNIVIIFTDDLGYADVGVYGQEKISTPRLDQMAREGMRFTQFYSAATVCVPAREALIRGLHTGHTRNQGNGYNPLQSEDMTIPKLLKENDYRSAMLGKWGLGLMDSEGRPDRAGFDYWWGFLDQSKIKRHYPKWVWENGKKKIYEGNKEIEGDKYFDLELTKEALNFITQNKSNPFFLYLPYSLPHADITAPPKAVRKYAGKFPETPFRGKHYAHQDQPNAVTAAMISEMDRYVGMILDHLKKLKLDQKTIVFFTSDNGPVSVGGRSVEFFDSNGPFRGAKRDLYEGGIRVPMIVWWPGNIEPNTVSDTVWSLTDILPTVVDLAGIKTNYVSDGESIAPTLLGETQDLSQRFLYWAHEGRPLLGDDPSNPDHWGKRGRTEAVRQEDWKAIRFSDGRRELYNLADDKEETKNVSSDHSDVLARLIEIMDREFEPDTQIHNHEKTL